MVKLLWIIQRSRPYLETDISFLCTRVKYPDISDWVKLRRVIQFLSQTIGDYRVIGAENIYEVLTYVDASYDTHNDMRGHTEVSRARNCIPFSIWLDMYMEHQFYKFKRNQLMQDNMSAMKMDNNGQNPCTGISRHINIIYFSVKDRFDKKEVLIVRCLTEFVLSDFFTKTLQGRLFHMFIEVIMGWKHISTLQKISFPSEERVGECISGGKDSKKTYVEALTTGMA